MLMCVAYIIVCIKCYFVVVLLVCALLFFEILHLSSFNYTLLKLLLSLLIGIL